MKKGFTLVELLIVIALISILSVAVLATINPIEQSNKAKDSTVQNDAAEVMNAYERYYANSQSYPWMAFGPAASKPSVEDGFTLRSDAVGFGICTSGSVLLPPTTPSASCLTSSTDPGLLIVKDELKAAFVGKDEFTTVGSNDENGLWTVKTTGSGGSIYVCYVPKAKSNRDSLTNTLWCLSDGGVRLKAGEGTCTAPTTGSNNWADPTAAISAAAAAKAGQGIFKCVP